MRYGFGLALLGLAGAWPSAANATWQRYETKHFSILSEGDPKDVTRFATRLETIDGLLRLATNASPNDQTSKVRIFQVANEGAIQQALGGNSDGVAGFYNNNGLGPFAVTPRVIKADSGANFTPEVVLFHEYAHHFMLQNSPGVYPTWYTEGFAEVIGSSKILPDGRVGYGMPAKQRGAYIGFDWEPVQQLLLQPSKRMTVNTVYGQGWALTHFLTFSKTRSKQLRQYLTALSSGKSDADAASAFGDLNDLNREAHRYVEAGSFPYVPVAVPLNGPVILSVASVSAGEAALVPETIALDEGSVDMVKKADDRARLRAKRATLLATIRRKSAMYPADPFAQRLLTEAEFDSGNLPQAEAAVDRLLAVQPNDVAGLSRKSMILSARAEKSSGGARQALAQQARTLAIKANRIDTDAPLPLVAFYRSFAGAGQQPSTSAINGLAAALDQRPYNDEIRHLLVDGLEASKRYSEAMSLLMILANAPHDSPAREAARAQLERLKAKAKAASAA